MTRAAKRSASILSDDRPETLRGYVRDAEMFEEHAGAGAALSRARSGLPRVPGAFSAFGPHASAPDRSVRTFRYGEGLDRSVARLIYHLEKIDALRLAALVI
jgi:hypothetical protein